MTKIIQYGEKIYSAEPNKSMAMANGHVIKLTRRRRSDPPVEPGLNVPLKAGRFKIYVLNTTAMHIPARVISEKVINIFLKDINTQVIKTPSLSL